MIFVFCCKDGKCYFKNCSDCFFVLRNQLKCDNKFYSYYFFLELDEINEFLLEFVVFEFKLKVWISLCDVCGSKGDKKCFKCYIVQYCCCEYQIVDWKLGYKNVCMKLCVEGV